MSHSSHVWHSYIHRYQTFREPCTIPISIDTKLSGNHAPYTNIQSDQKKTSMCITAVKSQCNNVVSHIKLELLSQITKTTPLSCTNNYLP